MAELRIRQGRLARGRAAAGRPRGAPVLPARAGTRCASPKASPHVACSLLERGLSAAEDDAIGRTQLLAPLVDACLAAGDIDGARTAAGRARRAGRDVAHPARGAPSRSWPPRACSWPPAPGRGRRARAPRARRLHPPGDAARHRRGPARAGARAGRGRSPSWPSRRRAALTRPSASSAPPGRWTRAAAVLRELGEATGARAAQRGRADRLARKRSSALLTRGMSNGRIARRCSSARRPPATTSAGSSPSSGSATAPRRPRMRPGSGDRERIGRTPDVCGRGRPLRSVP